MKNTIKYRIIKGKRKPLCDYHGTCKNIVFKEVYLDLGKKKKGAGWSYLCRKHFKHELKKLKEKLSYCSVN